MSMGVGAVKDAVRDMLNVHARRQRRFDRIHESMTPWDRRRAAARFGIPEAGGQSDERHIQIALDSQALFLPLVLDTFAQTMKVENFFTGGGSQSTAWKHWQRNQMSARQTGIHRSALEYGEAYATVLPAVLPGLPGDSERGALIQGVSPRQMVTYYGEPSAWPEEAGASTEWPILAMEVRGSRIRLMDETHIYYVGARHTPGAQEQFLWGDKSFINAANFDVIESREHGVGVTPVVRYRDRWLLDGEEQAGIIEPLISLQQRADRTAYEQGVAQYYAAFKQRYVIGWAPEDELQGARMKASDTWFIDADGGKTKVGQFDETDLTRYIDSRQATIRDLAAIGQVPAQSLGANAISNISADGLAAFEASKERKSAEIQTSLGESHEQTLRLAAWITGDRDAAEDFTSEVKWADHTARSFAQTVDGLTKMATMLGIPPELLVEDIPGWSREKVQRVTKALGTTRTAPEGTGLANF